MYDNPTHIGDMARERGLTIAEYLRQNYTREELDNLQSCVRIEMTTRQVAIDGFNGNSPHRRIHIDFNGLSKEELDAMHEGVRMELSKKRERARMLTCSPEVDISGTLETSTPDTETATV